MGLSWSGRLDWGDLTFYLPKRIPKLPLARNAISVTIHFGIRAVFHETVCRFYIFRLRPFLLMFLVYRSPSKAEIVNRINEDMVLETAK